MFGRILVRVNLRKYTHNSISDNMAVATHARRFRKAGAYMALALLLPFATIIDGVADILIKKGVSKRISQIAGTFFALCSLAAAVSISLRACANSVARPAAAAAAAGQNATSNVAQHITFEIKISMLNPVSNFAAIFQSVGAFIASILAFSFSTFFYISSYPWCTFCMLAFIFWALTFLSE